MKHLSLFLSILLLLITPALFAQDPVEVGKGLYKELFQNDRVRVLEVTVKPGESIAMHSHPAHLGYVLSGGKMKMTDSAGKVTEADPKPGDVLWFDAVTHKGENLGTTEIKIVIVELKK